MNRKRLIAIGAGLTAAAGTAYLTLATAVAPLAAALHPWVYMHT
jgi:hypothetical protein